MSNFNSAAQIRDEFWDFLLRMAGYFEPYPELRSAEKNLRNLAESLSKPFTLAVFGYMKTGKSSLINAMIGRPMAPIGTEETTATLNRISYGDATQEDSVVVHWKDGRPPEPIPFSRVKDWTGKSAEALARVRETSHLQFFANASSLKDVEIVDTPGIGSVASDHTMVASEVLSGEEGKKADALLYVFPAVAKALDAKTLDEFRKTRLPGSDPYNSIGVLHKWDGLEADDLSAEVGEKARELGQKLSDVLCEVIPVSAPLGLVARHAPDSFLEGLLELTTKPVNRDMIVKKLTVSDYWDADDARKRARAAYDLPWVSFVRVVRLLMEHSCDSAAAAKAVCLGASGIERIETELDRRFYRKTAIIKQRITRVKAIEPVKKGILFFNERIDLLRDDQRHFVQIASQEPAGGKHGPWLKQKSSNTERELRTLNEHAIRANRYQLAEEERMNLMERDRDFLKKMTDDPSLVDAADQDCIRRLLASSHDSGDSQAIPRKALQALNAKYQHEKQGPNPKKRELFEHLIRRVSDNLS
jgi:hypothetical protein